MLRNKDTKKQMCVGDKVTMKDGEVAEITDITERVYLMNESGIPTQPYGVFYSVVGGEWVDDPEFMVGGREVDQRTKEMHEWMKALPDDKKSAYAINWRIPHTLFNITCKFKKSEDIQGIDWFAIYKSKDLGLWSHGGTVYVQCFS